MIFLIILYFINSFLFNFKYFFKNYKQWEFYSTFSAISASVNLLTIPSMLFLIFFNFVFIVFVLYVSIGIIYAYFMNKKVLELMKFLINEEYGVDGLDIFFYIMLLLSNILSPGAFYIWFVLSKITFNNYFVSSFKKRILQKGGK